MGGTRMDFDKMQARDTGMELGGESVWYLPHFVFAFFPLVAIFIGLSYQLIHLTKIEKLTSLAPDGDTVILNGWGLVIRGWLAACAVYILFLLCSHVMPKSFATQENVQKGKSVGFLGASPQTDGLQMYTDGTDPTKDNFFPMLNDMKGRLNGMSDDALDEAFNKEGFVRILKMMALLAKMVLNCAFMWLNVRKLPERDPAVPLNEAVFYVVGIEFGVLLIRVAWLLIDCGKHVWLTVFSMSVDGWEADIGTSVRLIAGWSALKLLPSASLDVLGEAFDRSVAETAEFGVPALGKVAGAAAVFGEACKGFVGSLALALKMTSVAFVSEKLWREYSPEEVIRFLGFVSNVASIYDIAGMKMLTVQEFLLQDKEIALMSGQPILWSTWKRHLAARLAEKYGVFWCTVYMFTLTANDVKRLLIKQYPCVPQLMHDMLMREPAEVSFLYSNRRTKAAGKFFRTFPHEAPLGHSFDTCSLCQEADSIDEGEHEESESEQEDSEWQESESEDDIQSR